MAERALITIDNRCVKVVPNFQRYEPVITGAHMVFQLRAAAPCVFAPNAGLVWPIRWSESAQHPDGSQ